MSSLQNLLKTTHTFLKRSPVYSSLPMSVVSIGLEELVELNLSCPCNSWNGWLITFIFIGPFFLLWALMVVLLMPAENPADDNVVKNTSKCTSECWSKFTSKCISLCTSKFWKALAHSLIPPIMWIILLCLDGDYLACFYSTFEGDYVFDQKLNRKWCAPYEPAFAENKYLHQKYQESVSNSKMAGYGMLGLLGLLILISTSFWYFCKETPPVTEKSVETQTEERVDTVIQVYLNTQDQQGTRRDMQTGPHRSAQDPQVETELRAEENLHTEDPQGMRRDVPVEVHTRTQDPEGNGEIDIEDVSVPLVPPNLEGSCQL
ncbi:uncharacterized protein LOC130430756 [Triplophysa dalaica]|uniref:uncharacterized protein LOC130430756 n=1 Tax=Triplophysa dalaica TaxID=1582913 RepID=UPI0024DFB20E|nr:uncharacterized protein LOC130430756 [Triplophysa dalaica]XP_056615892.1 uncharacterized protein LOC130430756 [Triplophysa dalaica]